MTELGELSAAAAGTRAGPPGWTRIWRWRGPGRDVAVVLSVVAVILGDADRLRQFLFDRSLWNDEVVVGLNILSRGYAGLLHPLSGAQAAPPGWLWLERLSSQLFGNSEFALRFPELVAGLALPVLVALLGHRLLGRWGWLPVVLVALSPYLVFYSSELKPYGADATFTVLAILMTVYVLDRDLSTRWLLGWGATAAAVALVSWPGLFAVVSAAVVLGLRTIGGAPRVRRVKRLGWLLAVNVPWLTVLIWQYEIVLRPLRRDRQLQDFWASGYPASIHAMGAWVRATLLALVTNPLSLHLTGLVYLLVAVGAACLLIEQGWAALPMILVLPVTFAAAAVHAYPIEAPAIRGAAVFQQGRAALSLVPVCLFLAAASVRAGPVLLGLGRTRDRPGQKGDWRAIVAAGALTAAAVATVGVVAEPAMADAVSAFGSPATITESRSALLEMKRALTPGEAVFVDVWTMSVYRYYAARLQLPAARLDSLAVGHTCAEAATIRSLAPSGRFWMAFALPPAVSLGPGFVDRFVGAVEPVASVVREFRSADAWMVLLQQRTTPVRTRAHANWCLSIGGTVRSYRDG